MSLHPAVAGVRRGVRSALDGLRPGDTVLVACSGGADSLALASAAVHEGHRAHIRVIAVTVDHGLQEGSADQAARVVDQLTALGVDEAAHERVDVDERGTGPEDAARRARYDALARQRERHAARLILLGHTRDDQAETVLLGLTRGSGGRSLAGMRRRWGDYARPLLDVSRADTLAACVAEGLEPWQDPHNDDPRYTRVRVRQRVLPVLETELGPGVAATLARTADQVRDDVDALEALAAATYDDLRAGSGVGIPLGPLEGQVAAISSRVLRRAALDAGAIDAELFHVHVRALLDLVAGDLRGEVQLPGAITARRSRGRLVFGPTRPSGAPTRPTDRPAE